MLNKIIKDSCLEFTDKIKNVYTEEYKGIENEINGYRNKFYKFDEELTDELLDKVTNQQCIYGDICYEAGFKAAIKLMNDIKDVGSIKVDIKNRQIG